MEREPIQLLRTLVGIPSVNPALADDPAVRGEKRFASFLADGLASRGFRIEWLEKTPDRPNVIARIGAATPRYRIAIEGHTDTQGIHGMTVAPFAAEIRDGRLYGRGACDTKGPIVAALCAMDDETISLLERAGIELVFIAAMGEERGNLGAEEVVESGFHADEAIVLEPTGLNIVHAHKGTFWFEVEVCGRAAHGSQPEKGLSAVLAMRRVIDLVMEQTAAEQRVKRSTLLGTATANIGVIRGGASINIVPDRCVIEVDRRTLPGDDGPAILNRLREAIGVLQRAGELTSFDVRLIKDTAPFETSSDSPLVRGLIKAVEALGPKPTAGGVGWYSDAGPFSRACKQVAVFGPGHIEQAHTADEYIDLDQLLRGTEALRGYLRSAAARVGGSA